MFVMGYGGNDQYPAAINKGDFFYKNLTIIFVTQSLQNTCNANWDNFRIYFFFKYLTVMHTGCCSFKIGSSRILRLVTQNYHSVGLLQVTYIM